MGYTLRSAEVLKKVQYFLVKTDLYLLTEPKVRPLPAWSYFVDNFMKFYARLFAKLWDIRFDLHKHLIRKNLKNKN